MVACGGSIDSSREACVFRVHCMTSRPWKVRITAAGSVQAKGFRKRPFPAFRRNSKLIRAVSMEHNLFVWKPSFRVLKYS